MGTQCSYLRIRRCIHIWEHSVDFKEEGGVDMGTQCSYLRIRRCIHIWEHSVVI